MRSSESKKTQTRTDTASPFDVFGRDDQPLAATEPPGDSDDARDTPTQALRTASQSNTLRATAGITPNQQMRDLMSRMRDIEADPTDAGYPEPDDATDLAVRVDTDNLPAVADRALVAAGRVAPEFHQVANLPGNMNRAIRTMGRQLFRNFTRTPTEQIHMIGNVAGMGPNTGRELNAVAGYLRDQGENLGLGDLDLDRAIPGYSAEVNQFRAMGIRWLVVRDEFGEYIYAWPEGDSMMFRDSQARLGRD